MKTVICAALILLTVLGGYAVAAATWGPSFGVCYAVDGDSVQTTFLNGGGAFYPFPPEVTIAHLDDGFEVTHRTRFLATRSQVYLPVVSR